MEIADDFAAQRPDVVDVSLDEAGCMRREGRDPVLKESRWLLLRRSENLADEQHFRFRDLLRYNLKTVRAYLLKEAFQQLWDTTRPPGPASSSTNGAGKPCAHGSSR